MARPSAPTWNTITSKESASTTTSSSSCNLKFLIFSTIHHKRPRFTTFSFHPFSSSSCSSCSTSHATTLTHITNNKKSLQHAKTHDGSSFTLRKKDKKSKNESISKIGSQSNVEKRPLWRRILFASKKFRSIILLNVITVVYASDIPVVKAVEAIMDPAAFSAVRFTMSAIPFLPFVIWARDDVQTRNAGIELGLWVGLAYFVEAIGLLTSDAGRASFLSLFTVIVVPLLDGMFGAIIPARTWFGVFMSALGVAVLECSGSPPNVGDLLNFLSAIFYGIHMLRTEHISRSTKRENFLPLLGYEVSVVALLSTIWVLIGGWFDGVDNFDQSSLTWTVLWEWLVAFPWIPAFYTGVFSTGLCLWIEIAAMRDVSATETAIIYGLEPLWGAGFAWFLLGERWGTTGWIGAALVLGGSLIVQIVGSSSSNKSIEAEEGDHKGDFLMVSDKQKLQRNLSTSPVVVRSRNDVIDMLK